MTDESRKEFESALVKGNLSEPFEMLDEGNLYWLWGKAQQAATQRIMEMLGSEEMAEIMAVVMQLNFPVVQTGIDDKGSWCASPLEILVFKEAAKRAIDAIKQKVSGE